jgi:hypothetical protein
MRIPLLRTTANLLRALPNYLVQVPLKGSRNYPNIGRTRSPFVWSKGRRTYLNIGYMHLPYVWVICYRDPSLNTTLYIERDRSLRKAALKMLVLLEKNRGRYMDY